MRQGEIFAARILLNSEHFSFTKVVPGERCASLDSTDLQTTLMHAIGRVLGNDRVQTLPVWEVDFGSMSEDVRIATRKVKWDPDTQKRWEVYIAEALDLPDEVSRRIERVSKRIYRALELSGYARIDFRLHPDGELYFLEANPNPDIARDAEYASSAEPAGMTYEDLLQRILSIGLQRAP